MKFTLPPKKYSLNRQIKFPYDALCFIGMEGSALFSYQLHSIDTDTYYSDKPILCGVRKEFLPFSSYKGRVFSFDFENKSNEENHINLHVRFEHHRPSGKNYSFREYTLDGLYLRSPVDVEAGEEVEISLTNYRGGHYEVHQIYSTLHKGISCRVKYHNQSIEYFGLENPYRFKKPWVFKWPDSATLILKNGGNSKLEINPTEIYFAGYLLKPTRVIQAIAPINARNNFLIEGIRLR
jgi:hypothetical protein